MSCDALDVLRVLRGLGLDTRPDIDGEQGAWDADCPVCRPLSDGLFTLRITEAYPNGPVQLRCRNRCTERAILTKLGLSADGQSDERPKLRLLDVEQMLVSEPAPVPWIADGLLVRGAVTMLTGREGTGKSMLALAVASAIGQGRVIADIDCSRGQVLVVDAENGPSEAHRRLRALDVKSGALFYAESDGFNLRNDLGELEALLGRYKPDVLVLDSLRALAPGLDENDSGPAELTLRPLAELARRFGCAILLLHHSRKGGDEYRGSTAIGATVELGFALSREAGGARAGARRVLTCWKCRPAPEPEPRWFTLKADDGRVVIETAPPPESPSGRLSQTAELTTRLGEIAAEHEPLGWGELCAKVGVGPDTSTAKRARDQAVKEGLLMKVERGVYGPPPRSFVRPEPIGDANERTDEERGA